MPIPFAAIGAGLNIAGGLASMFGGRAADRANNRYINSQYAAFANELRQMFDAQMGVTNNYDQQQYGYERSAIGEEDTTLRQGFDRLLATGAEGSDRLRANRTEANASALATDENTLSRTLGQINSGNANERGQQSQTYREGFNALLGSTRELGAVEDARFSETTANSNLLLDTLQQVREGKLALSAEERQRQRDIQSQVDDIVGAFIGTSGAPGFGLDAAAAENELSGLVRNNVRAPTDVPGAQSADGRIGRDRARQQTEHIDKALHEADLGNRMISYDAGLRGQDRRQLQTGEAVSILDDKAARSASNLSPALQALGLRGDNAVASTGDWNSLINDDAQTRADILKTAFGQSEAARTQEAGTNLEAIRGFNSGTLNNIASRGAADGRTNADAFAALGNIDETNTRQLTDLYENDTNSRVQSGNNRWDRLITSTQRAANDTQTASERRTAIARDLFNTRVNSAKSRNGLQTIGQIAQIVGGGVGRL